MANGTIRRQPSVKGGRIPLGSCLLKQIRRAVERDAATYGVSKSWVVAVILAKHYKIDAQDLF